MKSERRDEQKRKIIIAPATQQGLIGIIFGLMISLIVDMPVSSWFIVGVLIVCCFGVFCFFNPYAQRFAYLLAGFFLGLMMLYVTRCFFLDWSLFKLNF